MKRILYIFIFISIFIYTDKNAFSYITQDSIKRVYLNYTNTCALSKNDELYCWGYNAYGENGDGTFEDSFIPKKILEDIKGYASYTYHLCAIKSNGDLYCWGRNRYGQIGIGNTQDVNMPTKIMSNVAKAVTGSGHTCALKTNNDLYCWGNNTYGQIGDGTTIDTDTPKKIMQDIIDISRMSAGSCAIKKNHDLYCWGGNANGKIGNNSTTNVLTPTKILEEVKNVIFGYNHTCAIKDNNDLYCWGKNNVGQIGNGTTTNALIPIKILENVKDFINNQTDTSCAITLNNELYCWGGNSSYTVGNGNNTNQLTPIKILDNVEKAYTVNNATCAIKTDGNLYCWGLDARGAAGFCRDQEYITTPQLLLKDIKEFAYNSYTSDITCAIKTNGKLYCWGSNANGRIGNGGASYHIPTKILENVQDFSSGKNHICYLNNNILKCKGSNYYKQIINDSDSLYETSFIEIINDVKKFNLTSNTDSSCVIKNDNKVYCWGIYTGNNSPTLVQDLENVKEVSVGSDHRCAILENNDLYCWGYNTYGQIGDNTTTKRNIPVKIKENIIKVVAGWVSTCAIDSNKDLYCWGANAYYSIGDGTTTNRLIPTKVNTLSNVKDVSLGNHTTCAILENNDLYCWGNNSFGKIGNNSTTNQKTPTKILDDVIKVSIGAAHTCAVKTNGDIYCWGLNSLLQCGKRQISDGSILTPHKIETTINNAKDIKLGLLHTCLITEDNDVYCFGNDIYGIIDGITSCDPQEIFDGSQGTPNFIDRCEAHWNYENLNKVCNNEKENACYKEGHYICSDGNIRNPSIVCDAETPYCCEDINYQNVGNTCYNGLGECKEEGTYYCSGNLSESEVKCDAVPGEPAQEFCDSADNDCDGEIDEDFGVGEYCELPNAVGMYECVDDNNSECKMVATFTPTFTPTNTPYPNSKVVTPQTILPTPVTKTTKRKTLHINLPKYEYASFKENGDTKNVKYKYIIHVRKLKRNGVKDKNFRLGKRILTYQSNNIYNIKNLDKGIYSIRYKIIIFNSKKEISTKWSKRNLVEI